MTQDTFIELFRRDILETDSDISPETCLLDIEEWDSLSIMSMVAFLDETFGIKVNFMTLQGLDTVQDLMVLAKIN